MEKILNIDGHEVKLKASGATPRIYRKMFRSDVFADMQKLTTSIQKGDLSDESLECLENIVYVMAYQGDPDIPDLDTWLDQFGMFSIYQKLPDIIGLWNLNEEQIESAKKKVGGQSGN